MICWIPESIDNMVKDTVNIILITKGKTLPFGPWMTYPKAYQILTKNMANPIEAADFG